MKAKKSKASDVSESADPDMLNKAQLIHRLMLTWGIEIGFLLSVIEEEGKKR